ncbi:MULTISPECIES: Rpn family recombination-promoting nuclease/putative transposase [Methylococcus]|uniref:Rpn family recombination-promoting nuclease/putative transposase n=1 Tax=Methylococcus capsulatus TaxID=414 RepID=A0ABZ2F2L7_METCP|nr:MULTISPECIES: Rpn family recombination-promoting nuclease/putative transposase [Methylococcus]MDF9392792.1 DUF4351 domain-containing protein [Methylococcus capsulatus]
MTMHDGSYKHIFSHAPIVEDLLRGFVHEDWVSQIDYGSLEKVSGSYVTDDLREREDDIIWRVRLEDDWLYIYLLIEFQSRSDPWMALRILVYTGLLYQDLVKSGQIVAPNRLPPTFPVVIYNGESPWRAACEVAELIEPAGLSAWRPSQRYFLLDEGRVSEPELAEADNTLAEIIRLEASPEPEAMRQIIGRLTQRLREPRYDSLRRALVVWINRVVLKRLVPAESIPEATELQEIDTMLAERVVEWTEKWKREGLQQGRQEGRQEGIQEGRTQGEIALLRRQLTRRFGPLPAWAEARLAQASTDQCEAWADRLLEAGSLEDVLGSSVE